MGKSLSVSQALSIRRSTLRLEGGWGNCVGEIDRTGVVPYHQDNRNNGIRISCFCDRQTKQCDGRITGYHSYKGRA